MSNLQQYSLQKVAEQDGRNGNNMWIVINGNVYDVTTYRDTHPGGAELLEEYAGQDATRAFEEFGHSSDAKKILKKHLIGELTEEDKMKKRGKAKATLEETDRKAKSGSRRFLSALCGKCAT